MEQKLNNNDIVLINVSKMFLSMKYVNIMQNK